MDDVTEVIDKLFLTVGLGFSLLFSRVAIVICPSDDFGFTLCNCIYKNIYTSHVHTGKKTKLINNQVDNIQFN